jgi:hypothetical protein
MNTMKLKYFILIIISLLAGLVLTSCKIDQENKVTDAKENVKQAQQDLKVVQSENDKEWQQFKKDAELKIKANEDRIDEFKAETKKAGNKLKNKYEQEVGVLEQKNIELKRKLSEYKYEGKDTWQQFKLELNDDIEVVGNSIKDLFARKD